MGGSAHTLNTSLVCTWDSVVGAQHTGWDEYPEAGIRWLADAGLIIRDGLIRLGPVHRTDCPATIRSPDVGDEVLFRERDGH